MEQNPSCLHIGGKEAKAGWKILNIQPADGVDFVGDIQDLSQFRDEMFDVIYNSHVLEHVPQARIARTLTGLHRILKPGGQLMISVPDLETLCKLFTNPTINKLKRFEVMRMMFGGQVDSHDFHLTGLTFEFMQDYLRAAKFKSVTRIDHFGIFNDSSSFTFCGAPVSLNLIARK